MGERGPLAVTTSPKPTGMDPYPRKGRSHAYDDTASVLAALCYARDAGGGLLRKALRESQGLPAQSLRRMLNAVGGHSRGSGRHDRLCEALTRLNAELVGARRDLAEKNAELARLHQRDRHIFQTLHRAFLQASPPQMAGMTVRAAYVPTANEAEAGGDWYDVFRLPDGRMGFSIGDVAGRGVRAAVRMVEVRDFVRALASAGHAPFFVLSRASQFLALISDTQDMATAVFGVLDPASRTVIYASAGHPQPILATPDGRVDMLSSESVPLGVWTHRLPPTHTVRLPNGALLVFYTDGLTELTRNVAIGETNLLDAVRCAVSAPSPDPAAAILNHTLGGRPHQDDIAVLTIMMGR
jgi:serine phosphatase RsbU (regulator of sigma subunit)